MGAPKTKTGTNKPLVLAKKLLRKALVEIPQVEDSSFDKSHVDATISTAVEVLESVISSEVSKEDKRKKVQQTMDLLREALEFMQGIHSEDPAATTVSQAVAKTLALLFPVSKKRPSVIRPSRTASKAVEPGIMERRAAPRVSIDADIGFQSETNFYTGFTEDISSGGLFLSTYDTSPIGSSLSVNFTLPNGHLVSVTGKVRWVREFNETTPDIQPGMGIRFENLSSEDKEAINRFIEQRQPMFYEE